MARRYVPLRVERVARVTDKAVCLRIDGEDYWFPRSQIQDGEEIEEDEAEFDVHVAEWLAEEKDLL